MTDKTPTQGAAENAAENLAVMSQAAMLDRLAAFPHYRAAAEAPALRHAAQVQKLWGGALRPVMASRETKGRFAQAALNCPPTACTGYLEIAPHGRSQGWRNPDAIENIVCLEGRLEVRYGPSLDEHVRLGDFDMVSVPPHLRHQLVNAGDTPVRLLSILSIEPGGTYDAIFTPDVQALLSAEAQRDLGLRLDDDPGLSIDAATMATRVTRAKELVPYKAALSKTAAIPPQATEMLSAGSVYPLIVPEGHIGRSRTAPIYGFQGLYISIAECAPGDGDGPPPHAHSDTQESFLVLNGTWDIFTGFDNESVIHARPFDIVAMPNKVMRSFANTSDAPSRLLVIIQGPDRMHDTVSFSRKIGAEVERRFGKETIAAYEKIRMTFDAEDRLQA